MNPNEIRELAIATLETVCRDEDAPAAAKAAAARTMLETIGIIGKNSTAGAMEAKGLSEMSVAELDREIMRLQDGGAGKALKTKA